MDHLRDFSQWSTSFHANLSTVATGQVAYLAQEDATMRDNIAPTAPQQGTHPVDVFKARLLAPPCTFRLAALLLTTAPNGNAEALIEKLYPSALAILSCDMPAYQY